jgi:hypothetical protein
MLAAALVAMIGTASQVPAGAVGIVFESGPSYGPVTTAPFFLHPPPFALPHFGSGEGLIDVHGSTGLIEGKIRVDPDDHVGQFGIIETILGSLTFSAPAGPSRTAVLKIAGNGNGVLNFPDPPNTNSAGSATLISNNLVDSHIFSLVGSNAVAPGIPFDIPLALDVPFQIPASTVQETFSRTVSVQLRLEGWGDVLLDAFNGVQFNFDLPPGVNVTSNFGFSQSASAVPEPGSLVLIGIGLTGLLVVRRRGRC